MCKEGRGGGTNSMSEKSDTSTIIDHLIGHQLVYHVHHKIVVADQHDSEWYGTAK